jgi:hypothetical protein
MCLIGLYAQCGDWRCEPASIVGFRGAQPIPGGYIISDGFAVGSAQYPDQDGDGLLDSWETFGIDMHNDGTIDVDLPAFGADPLHKDLFLEYDWVMGFAPTQAEIQACTSWGTT